VTEALNLFAQQQANRRRSRWLVIGFIAFFAWLGFGGDWIAFLATETAAEGEYRHVFPWLGILLTATGAAMTVYAWRQGGAKVLWSTGATELTDPRSPDEIQLVNVVDEMAIASGVPRPKIYVIRDADPNAFATGRDPQSAAIAVTEGLLRICTRDELQAVIGHEMGHIRNLDMQLMTLMASLVGTVALIAEGLGRGLRGTRVLRVGGGSRGKKGNPLVPLLLALWIISWILAPIITRMLALGVSRKREYLADAMAAQFTRNPLALASALEKIEREHAPTSTIGKGCAHLCIADPLGRAVTSREGWLADRLATHPPMAIRVSRLRAMAYQEIKRSGGVVGGELPGAVRHGSPSQRRATT
jgi:heat shock protein HtpX